MNGNGGYVFNLNAMLNTSDVESKLKEAQKKYGTFPIKIDTKDKNEIRKILETLNKTELKIPLDTEILIGDQIKKIQDLFSEFEIIPKILIEGNFENYGRQFGNEFGTIASEEITKAIRDAFANIDGTEEGKSLGKEISDSVIAAFQSSDISKSISDIIKESLDGKTFGAEFGDDFASSLTEAVEDGIQSAIQNINKKISSEYTKRLNSNEEYKSINTEIIKKEKKAKQYSDDKFAFEQYQKLFKNTYKSSDKDRIIGTINSEINEIVSDIDKTKKISDEQVAKILDLETLLKLYGQDMEEVQALYRSVNGAGKNKDNFLAIMNRNRNKDFGDLRVVSDEKSIESVQLFKELEQLKKEKKKIEQEINTSVNKEFGFGNTGANDIEIIIETINELKNSIKNMNSFDLKNDSFDNVNSTIIRLNNNINALIKNLMMLSSGVTPSSSLFDIFNSWATIDLLSNGSANERFMSANFSTGKHTNPNKTSLKSSVTKEEIMNAINDLPGADTVIHSHGNKSSVVPSVEDLSSSFKEYTNGIRYQIISSLEEIMVLDFKELETQFGKFKPKNDDNIANKILKEREALRIKLTNDYNNGIIKSEQELAKLSQEGFLDILKNNKVTDKFAKIYSYDEFSKTFPQLSKKANIPEFKLETTQVENLTAAFNTLTESIKKMSDAIGNVDNSGFTTLMSKFEDIRRKITNVMVNTNSLKGANANNIFSSLLPNTEDVEESERQAQVFIKNIQEIHDKLLNVQNTKLPENFSETLYTEMTDKDTTKARKLNELRDVIKYENEIFQYQEKLKDLNEKLKETQKEGFDPTFSHIENEKTKNKLLDEYSDLESKIQNTEQLLNNTTEKLKQFKSTFSEVKFVGKGTKNEKYTQTMSVDDIISGKYSDMLSEVNNSNLSSITYFSTFEKEISDIDRIITAIEELKNAIMSFNNIDIKDKNIMSMFENIQKLKEALDEIKANGIKNNGNSSSIFTFDESNKSIQTFLKNIQDLHDALVELKPVITTYDFSGNIDLLNTMTSQDTSLENKAKYLNEIRESALRINEINKIKESSDISKMSQDEIINLKNLENEYNSLIFKIEEFKNTFEYVKAGNLQLNGNDIIKDITSKKTKALDVNFENLKEITFFKKEAEQSVEEVATLKSMVANIGDGKFEIDTSKLKNEIDNLTSLLEKLNKDIQIKISGEAKIEIDSDQITEKIINAIVSAKGSPIIDIESQGERIRQEIKKIIEGVHAFPNIEINTQELSGKIQKAIQDATGNMSLDFGNLFGSNINMSTGTSFGKSFSEILRDILEADAIKIVQDGKSSLRERGLYWDSKTGKISNTHMYDNKSSFSPYEYFRRHPEARQYDTDLHTHPSRYVGGPSYLGNSADGGYGDLDYYYANYFNSEKKIKQAYIMAQENALKINVEEFAKLFSGTAELEAFEREMSELDGWNLPNSGYKAHSKLYKLDFNKNFSSYIEYLDNIDNVLYTFKTNYLESIGALDDINPEDELRLRNIINNSRINTYENAKLYQNSHSNFTFDDFLRDTLLPKLEPNYGSDVAQEILKEYKNQMIKLFSDNINSEGFSFVDDYYKKYVTLDKLKYGFDSKFGEGIYDRIFKNMSIDEFISEADPTGKLGIKGINTQLGGKNLDSSKYTEVLEMLKKISSALEEITAIDFSSASTSIEVLLDRFTDLYLVLEKIMGVNFRALLGDENYTIDKNKDFQELTEAYKNTTEEISIVEQNIEEYKIQKEKLDTLKKMISTYSKEQIEQEYVKLSSNEKENGITPPDEMSAALNSLYRQKYGENIQNYGLSFGGNNILDSQNMFDEANEQLNELILFRNEIDKEIRKIEASYKPPTMVDSLLKVDEMIENLSLNSINFSSIFDTEQMTSFITVINNLSKSLIEITERLSTLGNNDSLLQIKAIFDSIKISVDELSAKIRTLELLNSNSVNLNNSNVYKNVDLSKESESILGLNSTLQTVIGSIKEKTSAFEEEGYIVTSVVGNEINTINQLKDSINQTADALKPINSAFTNLKNNQINNNGNTTQSNTNNSNSANTNNTNTNNNSKRTKEDIHQEFLRRKANVDKRIEEEKNRRNETQDKIKKARNEYQQNEYKQNAVTIKEAIKNSQEYYELLGRSQNGTLQPYEMRRFEELQKLWKNATKAVEKYNDEVTNGKYNLSNDKDGAYKKASEYFQKSNRDSYISGIESFLDSNSSVDNNKRGLQYVDEYNNKIKELKKTLFELGNIDFEGTSDDFEKNVQIAERLKAEIKSLRSEMRADKNNEAFYVDTEKYQKWSEEISKLLHNNDKMSPELRSAFLNIQNQLQVAIDTDQPYSQVKQLREEILRLRQTMYDTGQTGKSFWSMFKERLAGANAQFLTTYFSFMDIIRYSRQAFETIKELDTALIDLKKTTKMTSRDLNNFYLNASDSAKKLGVSTKEVIDQAAQWSRLGYSDKASVTTMSELSSQFATISPGMDTGTATTGLVSIMKAFKYNADQVESEIMDKVNDIGNKFAVTNADVVTGLEKSSSAMSAANNSFEETVALFTAGNEILQNAETMGASLKTISMRVRGYDEETEELSSEFENLTGKVADLTKTANTPGGVSLFTDETKQTYKSTYQILKDISEIYSDLTDKQRANLLETLFGKTRAQAGAAILSNFSQAEAAIKTMEEESQGSSDRELANVQESISFKINAIKQDWIGLLQEFADRKALVGLLDIILKLSEAITALGSSMGPIASIFGLGMGAWMTKTGTGKLFCICKMPSFA